jgi:hypothetical protein
LAAYECLCTNHIEHHHRLWNASHVRIVRELQQTPKETWPVHEIPPNGHNDWFPQIMGEGMAEMKIRCDDVQIWDCQIGSS